MFNHIIIQGHLTADPVYRPAENGKRSSIWGKIGVYQGKDNNGNDLPSLFMEFTAFGRVDGTGDIPFQKGDLFRTVQIGRRNRVQQRLGIRMLGIGKQRLRRRDLHQGTKIHYTDPVTDILHHRKVMGNE